MAETRSINRSMMAGTAGNSFDFSAVGFGQSSPCNVQYTSVNASNSSLKCRALQAEGALDHVYAGVFAWTDSSTTAAAYGAAPYKMSDFYDLTLDTNYTSYHHVPASGVLSIGDASEPS